MMGSRTGIAVDRYLPAYDVRSQHTLDVDAPAPDTYRAARDLDLGRSIPVLVLFAIRALPRILTGKTRPTRSLTLDSLSDLGFVMLEDTRDEIVMGAVGKFWRPDSGMVGVAPEDFRGFDEPGYAKGIMAFTVEELGGGGSVVATETRVHCTSPDARRKFLLYWRAIGPFSGVIRKLMLQEVKRAAEAREVGPPS
jgi:hypothetical protein